MGSMKNITDHIIETLLKKEETVKECKNFVKNKDFDIIFDWLETLKKAEILLFMFELCKDAEFEREFTIIEGYYINKYKK